MPRLKGVVLAVVLATVASVAGCVKPGPKVEGTIGVVDPQRLLDNTNVGKKAKENLLTYSKNRQALIELEAKELRRIQEDTERQRSILSQEAFRERGEQFQRRMQEYQQKVAELNREVQEKQKDVLDSFRNKVETAVARIAKRLGLRVVLDRTRGGPTIYSEDTLDISDEVIEEINREYP